MPSKFDQLSDRDLRALLKKHDCPVGFHEVRARLMGNIASPGIDVAPLKELNRIWGGALPEFEKKDEAEQLIGGVMGGLWNALSKHQSRSTPFRLTRVKPGPATYEHLAKLSWFRREEIDAFIEGLFGDREEQDFPGTAQKALDNLGEIRGIFAGAHELCACPPAPASTESLEETLRNLRNLAVAAEVGDQHDHTGEQGCAGRASGNVSSGEAPDVALIKDLAERTARSGWRRSSS